MRVHREGDDRDASRRGSSCTSGLLSVAHLASETLRSERARLSRGADDTCSVGSNDSDRTYGVEIEVVGFLHDHFGAAGVPASFDGDFVHVRDLVKSRRGLRNLLGVLDDLLCVLLDDLFFLFNDLVELFDSLFELLFPLLLLLLSPVLDLFVDFLGRFGGDLDVDIFGLLLDFLGLFLELLDGLLHIDDLGVDLGVFLFLSLQLCGVRLDRGLQGLHLRSEGCDLVLNLSLLRLLLRADDLLLELCNLLLVLGHSGLGSFDAALVSHNLVPDDLPLSGVLLGLLLSPAASLVGGMLVSDSVLLYLNGPVSVVIVLSASANSVDSRSLNFLVLLLSVVSLSSDCGVGSVIGLPGSIDFGDGCGDGRDVSGDLGDVLLVLLDFGFD